MVVQVGLDGIDAVRDGDFVNVKFRLITALLTFGQVNLKVAGTDGI